MQGTSAFEKSLNSQWDEASMWERKISGRSKKTGEIEVVHYDGSPYPDADSVSTIFNMRLDADQTVDQYRKQYQQYIMRFEQLIENVKGKRYWEDEGGEGGSISFSFEFPNGKQADVDYYIAQEYGVIEEEIGIECKASIDTKHREKIALIMNFFDNGYAVANNPNNGRAEISKYLHKHNRGHILRDLADEFIRFNGMFQYHPLRNKARALAGQYMDDIRKERTRIYGYLVSTNRDTGGWVSERKLYRLISEKYPDAIYQYQAEWLGQQSLDIFIPSKNTGIEYQGKQHYESVNLFGGDQGLEDNKRRDKEKKEKCEKQGINLIEWKYTIPITEENLEIVLNERKQK